MSSISEGQRQEIPSIKPRVPTSEERVLIEAQSMADTAHRETKELVSLGGYSTTASGKLTKSNYFRFLNLDLDDYSDIQMTPRQAKRISTHLQKLSTGSHAMVPLNCAGGLCPFASKCPLQVEQIAPIGKQCILEVNLLKRYIIRYFEVFKVDPNNFVEVGFISELAELIILDMRLNMNLAKHENASLMIQEPVGADRAGVPIFKTAISPFIELKERLSSRRQKIIKLMAGDRQEKWKMEAALKVKIEDDPSSKMAFMAKQLSDLQRSLGRMQKEAETAEYFEIEKSKTLSPEDLINSRDE